MTSVSETSLANQSVPCITVIGAGLAGSECAWQAAEAGVRVNLYEMRPLETTGAHQSDLLAELVCSNSLGADALRNANGLLKEELRQLNSLIINCADEMRVPAGGALAVDRWGFSKLVTEKIAAHPMIKLIRERVDVLPPARPLVIASGPLTAEALSQAIAALTGCEYLHFFDAAAPIVTLESLNMDKLYWASRYDKGSPDDYLNAPMNEEEYHRFINEIVAAELHEGHAADKKVLFEGCLPIEELARRGVDTPRYGPLKPVGLKDPRTGKRPYAVVQLRRDNAAGTLFNLVGFQTRLKIGEQKRVFSLIPGLEHAEFVRYGVMHRNTFINSPALLLPTLQFRRDPALLFAGQITGSEGYVEAVAGGWLAGVNAARIAKGLVAMALPEETAFGALFKYVTSGVAGGATGGAAVDADGDAAGEGDGHNFQPMNVNYGLMPPLGQKVDKKQRSQAYAERSLHKLNEFKAALALGTEMETSTETR